MGSLEAAHSALSRVNEIMNNIIKQSEETHSLMNIGAPTGDLNELMDKFELLATRLTTMNTVIRMMQELCHSLGQSVKVNAFRIKEIEHGRKQYIHIEYEFKLPQFQSPTVLTLIVGYANKKFAVYYSGSNSFIVSEKVFRGKWWPKIANGILNNSDKLE